MTGLSVLYANEATKEQEWATTPDRDKTGRLREVYWAQGVESEFGRKSFISVKLRWQADRREFGRSYDEPGDRFIYTVDPVDRTSRAEDRFEWLEVTEVFTTVPAQQIDGAMRAWNRIPCKNPVDFDGFRKGLQLKPPSRMEQRYAADRVIAQVKRKLAKSSYQDLLERYGYGTLVVGMPLWFAVPPLDPFRAENALDDFMTRTSLGLEDVKQGMLRRGNCPFKRIIVKWDTTPQAMRIWRKGRSAEYEDPANASLANPLATLMMGAIPDVLEEALLETATPENEAPSMSLYLDVETGKMASGTGPYPQFIEVFSQSRRERNAKSPGRMAKLQSRIVNIVWKFLRFLRIVRRWSVSHAWRARIIRRRSRRLYRESRRRGRFLAGLTD